MAETIATGPRAAEVVEVLKRVFEHCGEPLTVSKLRGQVAGPYRMPAVKLESLLDQQVADGRFFRFAPYGSKAPRYWHQDHAAYARQEIRRELTKQPLSLGALQQKVARRLVDCPPQQRKSILETLVAEGFLRHLPPVPKGRTSRYSAQPPDPADYLRAYVNDFVRRVSQQAERLADADVDPATTWRVANELLTQSLANTLASDATHPQPGAQALPSAPVSEVRGHERVDSRAGANDDASELSDCVADASAESLLVCLNKFVRHRSADGPISVREFRHSCDADLAGKPAFDAALLDLARSGRVTLFRHDYPASLDDAERQVLVHDGSGNYFNALALTEQSGGSP